jgi:S-(hydroxymethyl)glutathione dehydrogenase/alcohol dehydrogenase
MARTTLSRRGLLKQGAAAAGGAAIAAQGGTLFAQAGAPAVRTVRRFRGWVSRGAGPGRTTLQEMTLRPIAGRQVVVRTEATNLCYSNVGPVLGIQRNAGPPPVPPPGAGGAGANAAAPPPAFGRLNDMALVQGHGGVGIVEAVGPDVRRVQVGDRVCVSGTPHCGACYQCLRGRSDMCQFLGRQGPDDLVPMADLADGTSVYQNSHIGGLAEIMVTFEEWVVPIFTNAAAADLGMVCSCVSVAGLGATTAKGAALVEPGSTVAVVGCGPLGLSAVQGARISGASTIIAIDPIDARRALALTVGATVALDPNAEGSALVERVRALSSRPNGRLWAGGRDSGGLLGGAAPTSSSRRSERMRCPRGWRRVPIRRAFCRCARRTKCARPAATS